VRIWKLRFFAMAVTLGSLSNAAVACGAAVYNQILVSRGNQILWNSVPIDRTKLIRYIRLTNSMNPKPFMFADYQAGAHCAIVRSVFKTVALTSGEDRVRFGRVGIWEPTGKGCGIPIDAHRTPGGPCGPSDIIKFLARRQ